MTRDRMLPGELWQFSDKLVFIPPEGLRYGLSIGKLSIWLIGHVRKEKEEIKLGEGHMIWQQFPPNRNSGSGWKYFGFEKLNKKLPEEVKVFMLRSIFGDLPKDIEK